MTDRRRTELEQLFEQGYRALGVMERHLGGREFFVGENPTIDDVARMREQDPRLPWGSDI